MKTIVVGDIHGRVEVVEDVLKLLPAYDVVFMGDFLDSFDRSKDDQIKALTLVLDAIHAHPNSVASLKGNHEISYLEPLRVCSGYSTLTQTLVDAVGKSRIEDALLPYVYTEGFLISHAGVSTTLLTAIDKTLDEYLADDKFYDVGRSRGGRSPCGGLYWCDWFREFEPVEGVAQIVGHSGYRPRGAHEGILRKGNSYNVDCLEYVNEVLLIEDGEAEIKLLEDLTCND